VQGTWLTTALDFAAANYLRRHFTESSVRVKAADIHSASSLVASSNSDWNTMHNE